MIVECKNVSKIYRVGEVSVSALSNVSLGIKAGEYVAIVGPSGSGKSTLMHVLGLLDNPTSGKVYFEGKDVSRFSEDKLAVLRNKKIGFVFQSFNLLERTPALENVILPLVYSNVTRSEMVERGRMALETVGLSDRASHLPSQLSGGEQQRVAIARALVSQPEIIFADEPTGNLDTKSGREIMGLFNRLNKTGKTLVVVTHDVGIARQAGRVIRVKDGKIV